MSPTLAPLRAYKFTFTHDSFLYFVTLYSGSAERLQSEIKKTQLPVLNLNSWANLAVSERAGGRTKCSHWAIRYLCQTRWMSRALCAANKKTRLERPLRPKGSKTNKQEVERTAGAEMLHHVSSPLFQTGDPPQPAPLLVTLNSDTGICPEHTVQQTRGSFGGDAPVTKPLQQLGHRLHGAK